MAFSMTGFGRGEACLDERKVTVEIKSVNNRYCDIQIRQPRIFAVLENRIRETVSRRLSRGKIDLFISYEDNRPDSVVVKTDLVLAEAYVDAYRTIADATSIPEGLSAAVIGRLNDVVRIEAGQIDENSIWQLLSLALEQALNQIQAMRALEGDRMVADIRAKQASLEAMLLKISQRAPTVPDEYRQKLQQRVQDLLDEPARSLYDEQRLAAEVAIYADRCSIDEELVRLSSHFDQMGQMLADQDQEPIGKKLDFLMQEMNREINTIGSKANDLTLTRLVVDMKSELEKIREQIQNLE